MYSSVVVEVNLNCTKKCYGKTDKGGTGLFFYGC